MVISDTHIPERAKDLPPQLISALEEASLIVHAGDICEYWVVEELLSFAPLFAVQGNMDKADVKAKLKEKEIFEVAGKRIGLVHGWGSPWGIEKRISEVFKGVSTDII
ncbi:MAG: YfcE family phosphodiesterase, partial [Candidatus Atribacteria bacterium]|nr:YfcE family phosphodiesterase [Candidatus Atribacteria bacterium]MCD6350287.1 YfcE family phosphodiesterase [Candidatus Atribacteria bacterium]